MIATTGSYYGTGSNEHLEIVDPSSGTPVWQSPELAGYVGKHSLSFYDLQGSGNLQLVLGTSVGMLVTR